MAQILRATLTLVAIAAVAQTPDSGVFRITSTLIQVDAIVTDSKGHQVTDLKPGDFEITVDGKAYPVANASYIWTNATPVAVLPYQVRKQDRKDAPAPPPAMLNPDQVKRTMVLVVDDLSLSWESMAFVKSALKKFVERQMQPGDLVALVRTGSGSGAGQELTNDKNVLLAEIDRLRWNPNVQVNVFEPYGAASDLAMRIDSHSGSPDLSLNGTTASMNDNLGATLSSLRFIVSSLRPVPGRKSVIFFSDGMWLAGDDFDRTLEISLHNLIDSANRSGTVFYTFDARALQTLSNEAGDRVAPTAIASLAVSRDLTFNATQQGLSYIADQTGGLAYRNGNDLNFGLARMLEDQQGYYLLAFKPDASVFSQTDGRPRYNRISVRARRPGLHVRSRSGFYGTTDGLLQSTASASAAELRDILFSPFLSHGIHVKVTALYTLVKGKRPVVRNLVYIDPKDLQFEPDPDGQSEANIELFAIAVGAEDRLLASVGNQYTATIHTDQLAAVRRQGMVYQLDVPLLQPGSYQIRVAVRDQNTLAIGSAHHVVLVPNTKKTKLALTSLILSSPEASGSVLLTEAQRIFKQGDVVSFASFVEGDAGTAELRLYRNNIRMLTTPVKLSSIPGQGKGVTGYFKLPPGIDPGEYYVEVVVRDANKPKRFAWQWTDFEVLPRDEASMRPVPVSADGAATGAVSP